MWKTLFVALAAVVATGGTAWSAPAMWVVRDADSEMLLFGSVHVLPPGLDWMQPTLAGALKAADDLWFELPVDAATEQETARLAGERGLLPAGQALSSLLSPSGRARLARVEARFDVPPGQVERFEPWLAEVVLAGAAFLKAGAQADAGVEKVVAAKAPASARRRAFETPAEQIALFDFAPLPEQVAALEETLKEMDERPDEYEKLLDAWLAGDVKALDAQALQPLREASPVLFKRLVTDRNSRWITALKTRMAGSGRTVVVVGVGHLIGTGGLPTRLRALGYKVEGP